MTGPDDFLHPRVGGMERLARLALPAALPWEVAVFAGAALAQLASSTLLFVPDAGELLWLPGGVLLAALIRLPRPRWAGCTAGAWLGVCIALSARGELDSTTAVLMLIVLALVPMGVRAFLFLSSDRALLRTFNSLAWFLGVFAFDLPLVAAVLWREFGISHAVAHHVAGWLQFALAHALGYMAFTPAWFVFSKQRSPTHKLRVGDWRTLQILGCVAVIAAMWLAFGSSQHLAPLLLLAPIPMLIYVAVTGRGTGTYLFFALLAGVGLFLTVRGEGPFAQDDQFLSILSLKSWVFAVSVATWSLAMLIEQRESMRERAHDALDEARELARRLMQTQEQERARLARDLHDDISQRLALLSIQASAARRAAGARAQAELNVIQEGLVALSADVRQLSHNLHPSMLREMGLAAALGSLCGAQRHRNGPSINLRVEADADHLAEPVALCLYRAAQEALGNSVRHARAQNIEVTLETDRDQALLEVTDDGIGFEPTNGTGKAKGLGLFSLEERAKQLRGEFRLSSRPQKGTRVCVRIPLQH